MTNTTDDPRQTIRNLQGRTISKAKRVAAMMPDIEQKLEEGVRQDEIIAALSELGIDLDIKTFRNYLYRYRKKQRGGKQPKQSLSARPSRLPESSGEANGNSQQPDIPNESPEQETPEAEPGAGESKKSLNDILDARARDEYGYESLTPRKSLIKPRSRN